MGISFVGTLWIEGGLNEAGLALMQTAGPIAPNQDGYGVVCNIAPRLILARNRSVKQAVEDIRQMRTAGWGYGAVLADSRGNLSVVEKAYDWCACRPIEAGAGWRTNHFVEPGMERCLPIPHPGLEQNSRQRYTTVETLVTGRDWQSTVDNVQNLLGYHGPAGFVCQHGDSDLFTNYSCIAIARDRKILLGDGYPCEKNYTTYRL